jgi:hypothetical protein
MSKDKLAPRKWRRSIGERLSKMINLHEQAPAILFKVEVAVLEEAWARRFAGKAVTRAGREPAGMRPILRGSTPLVPLLSPPASRNTSRLFQRRELARSS